MIGRNRSLPDSLLPTKIVTITAMMIPTISTIDRIVHAIIIFFDIHGRSSLDFKYIYLLIILIPIQSKNTRL